MAAYLGAMQKDNPLQQPIYWLSDYDALTAAIATESILVTGSPGSGKSSTAMMQIIAGFLRNGYGGMFLSAKAEDTANYIDYVRRSGRLDDLIVFGPDSGETFDPIYYLWNRPGRGAAMLETIVDMFTLLMLIGSPHSGKSHEPFWERKSEQLMRAAIVLLHLAGKEISIRSIDEMIATFPTAAHQHETAEWQAEFCGQALLEIRNRRDAFTPQQWNDFSRAVHFACVEWASMDSRVQSSVLATWTGLADKFLYEPFLSVFSSGRCTWIPEDATQGNKIILVDFPSLEGGDTFRIATCLVKLVAQQAFIRRDIARYATPAFLVIDECQLYALPKGRDERFNQVCRSARICSLYATQNLLQLAAEFGEETLGPRTKGWLSTISTRIAMQQMDNDSNEATADVIGKIYRPIGGTSVGAQNASVSSQMQLAHRFLPADFTTLKKASPTDPTAHAVVFSGGRRFNATKTEADPVGEPYLVTEFSREL